MNKTKDYTNQIMDKLQKKNMGNDIIKTIPSKILKNINIPKKNLKNMLNNVFKLSICGYQKCQKELINLTKIGEKKDIKVKAILKKLQDGKITQEKANTDIAKINSKFQNSKENLKYIECSLKNCTEFMKKQLFIMIDNLNTKFKDDKVKLEKLKTYSTLFNKKDINIKDVRQFYKEFI